MFESLFNKAPGLTPATLLKRDSNTGVFPGNIAKCLRTAFLIEQLRWLIPIIGYFSENFSL